VNLRLPSGPGEGVRFREPWLAAGVLGALGLILVMTGVIELPRTSSMRSRSLSDTLGVWTYALVAALAFLETGAFVGSWLRGRPRSSSAAWWRRTATSTWR
jgi:multisubunit Na+/H+ antiporter MnhB subunit